MLNSILPRLVSAVGTGASVAEPDASETGTAGDGGLEDRLRRAKSAATFDESGTGRLGRDDAAEFDVNAVDLVDRYPTGISERRLAKQARNRSKVRERPMDTDRAGRVASIAHQQAAADTPPSGYVASFLPVFEQAIDRAVDDLREGADPETIQTELKTTVRAAMVDM